MQNASDIVIFARGIHNLRLINIATLRFLDNMVYYTTVIIYSGIYIHY